jgi:release factor glutamine methyltransferase
MFVKDNSIASVLGYFEERLSPTFSSREIKAIAKSFIAKRLNWESSDFLIRQKDTVSESDLLYFRNAVKRVIAGEPVQYVLGTTFFYNLEIDTDKRALIPRPETEELVDWMIKDFTSLKEGSLIDIGTGSGCIALAMKKAFPLWSVTAVDISNEALSLVAQNALKNQLEIALIEDSALNFNEALYADKYTVIVSNPPYIPKKDSDQMAQHVLDFEPAMALFVSDNDSLIFYQKIAEFALKKLALDGTLYVELNENLAKETEALLNKIGFNKTEMRQDLQGRNRMLKAWMQQ